MPKAAPKTPAAPRRRNDEELPPDSLPPRDEIQPDDILPDDLRRIDESEVAPDSLPRPEDNLNAEGSPMTGDGGNPAHPVHDEDMEDSGPEDYEEELDEAAAQGDVFDVMRRGQ